MSDWLAHAVFGLLLFMPWQSMRSMQTLNETLAREPDARIDFYRSAINGQWFLAVLVCVALWLRDPNYLPSLIVPRFSADALALAAVTGFALATQSPLLPSARERMRRSAAAQRSLHRLRNLLPRSDAERRAWIGVAITAGFCEELVFRAFVMFYAQQILGMEVVGAIMLSSAVFAVCHIYQGAANVLRIGLVGIALAAIMVVSESLLFCIVLHTALDLGALKMGELVAPDSAADNAAATDINDP